MYKSIRSHRRWLVYSPRNLSAAAASSGVFSTETNKNDNINLANAASPTKHYKGQAAADSDTNGNTNINSTNINNNSYGNFLKYYLVGLFFRFLNNFLIY